LNITAAVFFWGIEIVVWAQRNPTSFLDTSVSQAAFLYLTHTLPLILIICDWWHNSIRVTFSRATIYYVLFNSYLGVLSFVSDRTYVWKPYYSIDFSDEYLPLTTAILSGVLGTFGFSLYVVSVLAVRKLGPVKEVDTLSDKPTDTTTGGSTTGGGTNTDATGGGTVAGDGTSAGGGPVSWRRYYD